MALQISFHNQLVSVGDTIKVSQKIKEGEKERLQNFEGVVIAIGGNFGERTVMVRRIAAGGIGVEKIIPVDSPSIEKVKVVKGAQVRRAKLYYLRERKGKMALKLKEKSETGSNRRARRPKILRKKRV